MGYAALAAALLFALAAAALFTGVLSGPECAVPLTPKRRAQPCATAASPDTPAETAAEPKSAGAPARTTKVFPETSSPEGADGVPAGDFPLRQPIPSALHGTAGRVLARSQPAGEESDRLGDSRCPRDRDRLLWSPDRRGPRGSPLVLSRRDRAFELQEMDFDGRGGRFPVRPGGTRPSEAQLRRTGIGHGPIDPRGGKRGAFSACPTEPGVRAQLTCGAVAMLFHRGEGEEVS